MQPIASPGGAVGVMIRGRLIRAAVGLLNKRKARLMSYV
jgi:hypothetical protein